MQPLLKQLEFFSIISISINQFQATLYSYEQSFNHSCFLQEILGDYSAFEIHKQCQFLLNHSTKMKRFWLEKSCCKIISTQIRKISIQDLPSVGCTKSLKLLSSLSSNFLDLLFDPIIFKVMLVLLLTDSSMSEFTNLRNFYMKTLFRRLCCFYRQNTSPASTALKSIMNATRAYQHQSQSFNHLLC